MWDLQVPNDYKFETIISIENTNFVGEITSKQKRRSESLTGRTVQIRKSSSITVGTSPSPRFLYNIK